MRRQRRRAGKRTRGARAATAKGSRRKRRKRRGRKGKRPQKKAKKGAALSALVPLLFEALPPLETEMRQRQGDPREDGEKRLSGAVAGLPCAEILGFWPASNSRSGTRWSVERRIGRFQFSPTWPFDVGAPTSSCEGSDFVPELGFMARNRGFLRTGVSRGCEGGGGWKRGNRARRARESDRFDTASDGRCPHRGPAKSTEGVASPARRNPLASHPRGKLVTRASPQPSPRLQHASFARRPPSSKKAPSRSERGEAENPLGAKPASHPFASTGIRRGEPTGANVGGDSTATAQNRPKQRLHSATRFGAAADHAQDGPHSSATCR